MFVPTEGMGEVYRNAAVSAAGSAASRRRRGGGTPPSQPAGTPAFRGKRDGSVSLLFMTAERRMNTEGEKNMATATATQKIGQSAKLASGGPYILDPGSGFLLLAGVNYLF